MVLNAGDEVTVKRSNGEFERGWYLWTDVSNSGFQAPEMLRVKVIKRIDEMTAEEMLALDPETIVATKRVNFAELIKWQNEKVS